MVSANVADVHSLGAELAEDGIASGVLANSRDQTDPASKSCDSDGLVGPLSPGGFLKHFSL
jgi:hypothetical protein